MLNSERPPTITAILMLVAVKFNQMEYILLAVAILFFLFMCICLLSAMGRMNDELKDEERRKKNKITGGGLQGW